jgi:hypothetical protein
VPAKSIIITTTRHEDLPVKIIVQSMTVPPAPPGKPTLPPIETFTAAPPTQILAIPPVNNINKKAENYKHLQELCETAARATIGILHLTSNNVV